MAYRVDRDASTLYVVTHRTGLLSFLGHEHAIVPGEWSAEIRLSPQDLSRAHATITVHTRALAIDGAAARAEAGLGRGPSTRQTRGVQEKMLDRAHLDAAEHPEIRLEMLSLREEGAGRLAVRGEITVRGTTRPVEFPARLERLGAGVLRVEGEFHLRQSEFGIAPESIAGVVRVADEVDVHFALRMEPVTAP